MAFTVDQLCLRTAKLTGMSDAASTEDRTLMALWVDEAITKVFQDTQCVVTKVNVTLTAGEDEYAIDRGILTVLNYAQSSTNPSAKISPISAQDILERRFLTSTGFVRFFAVLGGNILIFSPMPSEAQIINFYVVPVPDVMGDDGDNDIFDTGLPVYAQRAVECWMYARAFEQARDFRNAEYWEGQYKAECSNIKITTRRQAGRTLPAGRVGYPDRMSSASRNDIYPGYPV